MKRFCTGSPNFNRATQSCCERHDIEYRTGCVTRAEADRRLLICVASHGHPWRAALMFVAVRLFGWIYYRG